MPFTFILKTSKNIEFKIRTGKYRIRIDNNGNNKFNNDIIFSMFEMSLSTNLSTRTAQKLV